MKDDSWSYILKNYHVAIYYATAIHSAVCSFTALITVLLTIQGICCFLTDRVCQDILESNFGK